jgi:GT2 family glycosyltransferase
MARPDPELSVVLTLLDHQGHAVECIESWTRNQDLPRERYEVLVVGSGGEPEVEESVRPLLTADDRLLRLQSSQELELHDHGARAARGRWLLFTEGHCVAEPVCLSSLLGYLTAHESEFAGACIRSTPDGSSNPISKCEQRWFAEGFAEWSREGDWRKVNIRGFGILRDVYLDAGGFEHRFGCFAEVALAATLDDRGYRLGYASAAAVKHYDATDLALLLGYVREYREGELAYRATHPPQYCERYFGGPMPPPLGRAGRIRAWLRLARARARFARSRLAEEERYGRFRELWTAASDWEQQRALRGSGGSMAT